MISQGRFTMNNLDYFALSANHPEPILDPFYEKGVVVIPPTATEHNFLTDQNARLVELISAFHVLDSHGQGRNDSAINKILVEIRDILDNTPQINYSAFSQFFMVYSFAYSSYSELDADAKLDFLFEMLKRFCFERHIMYLSHGYSNSILQVVSDNYSHKRNSKTSIDKVLAILTPLGFIRITNLDSSSEKGFFLPDKGDHGIFETFRSRYSIELRSAQTEQDKTPDIVFGINQEWFIVELKNIKGSGGGQDKQLTEIINFVRYSEKRANIHYLVFLDGDYANRLFAHTSPKIQRQYDDVRACLQNNPNNFFVNTAGFTQFVHDFFS